MLLAVLLLGQALTPEMGDVAALHIDYVRPGVARAHVRPVHYVDSRGELHRIVVDLERDGNVLREDRNVVQFEANSATKRCQYSVGRNWIRLTLHGRGGEDGVGASVGHIPASVPVQLKSAHNKARWSGALGTGVSIDYQVLPGRVKEIITIGERPELGTSEAYLISWRWAASGLTPTLEDGAVVWRTAGKDAAMRMPKPVSWDAEQAPLTAFYRVDATTLAIVLDATELAAAAYPVTVDPTVDSSDASESASTFEDAFDVDDDGYHQAFILIPLPDLTGFTSIDAAYLKVYSASGGDEDCDVHCDALSAGSGEGWTSASGFAVLEALSFNAATASISANPSAGWNSYDVLGSAGTNGIAEIYDNDASPTDCSVKLHWTGDTPTPDGESAHLIYLGVDGSGLAFSSDTASGFEPYIEISYSGGPTMGQGTGSGTVGVLMP